MFTLWTVTISASGAASTNRAAPLALCEGVPEGAELGMEACGAAHYWGRELERRGYRVKLLPAQFVKPYVKSHKNDRVDAEAICEAMSRPTMRSVAVKSVAQQDMQVAHRIRESLVGQRTAKANQIRGLAGEYGLIAPAPCRSGWKTPRTG